MCVTIPGRVTSVGPEGAEVQMGDRLRRVSTLLLPEIEVGDYVLVSAGTIVERLTPEEAEERLTMFDMLLQLLDEVGQPHGPDEAPTRRASR